MNRGTVNLSLKHKGVFLILVSILLLAGTSSASGKLGINENNLSSRALRSMARVYMAYGENNKAQPLTEKALALAEKENAPDSELAMCHIDLAVVYKNQNRFSEAQQLCESGLELQKKGLSENHPYLAYTMRILSSIHFEQGNYDQAKSVLEDAIVVMLDLHTVNDSVMAPFFVDIAKIYMVNGDLEQAESYYEKAMVLINGSYGPDHLYTANVSAGIAKLYTLQGKYDQAEELINRVVAIQERVYGLNHHLVATSWLVKAAIYQQKGDIAKAEGLMKKALTTVEKTGNSAEYTKLQQDVKDIRLSKLLSYGR